MVFQKSGTEYIFSKELERAEVCVLVLKDGCVAEYGTAEQVLKKPRREYTKNLLAAVPRLWRK